MIILEVKLYLLDNSSIVVEYIQQILNKFTLMGLRQSETNNNNC